MNATESEGKAKEVKTYFTLGQNHVYHIQGHRIDRWCVVCLKGPSHEDNRKRSFDVLNRTWCYMFQNNPPPMKDYPKGIIELD